MPSFDTEAVFEARVSQRSLRDARATIEDELGGIEVDVAAPTSGNEIASRERAMSRQLQDQQLDTLAGISDQLENDRVLDEWEVEHELSRERNLLLEQLLEQSEKDSFNKALNGGGGLGGVGALAGVAGVALGGGLISFLQDFKFDAPDIPDVGYDGPASIPVDAPDSIPVDSPESIPVDIPPIPPLGIDPPPFSVPIPVAEPGEGGETGGGSDTTTSPDTDGTGTTDVPPNPFIEPDSVADPTSSPGDTPSYFPSRAPGAEVVVGGIAAGSALGAAAKYGSRAARGAKGAAGVAAGAPAAVAADAARDAKSTPRGQQSWLERLIDDALPDNLGSGASTTPIAAAGVGMGANMLMDANRSGQRQQTGDVNLNASPTFNLQGVSRRDLDRTLDQMKSELLSEVEKKLGGGGSGRLRR